MVKLGLSCDRKKPAVDSHDGQVMFFFAVNLSEETILINGRCDISSNQKSDHCIATLRNKFRNVSKSIAYTAEGQCMNVGGNSKRVFIYRVSKASWQIFLHVDCSG